MNSRLQFAWGCIGVAAVEVIRVRNLLSASSSDTIHSFHWAYVAAVLAIILVGGAWSVALESHNKFLAFYHGATASIIISFLAR